jgi:hypothetical protein
LRDQSRPTGERRKLVLELENQILAQRVEASESVACPAVFVPTTIARWWSWSEATNASPSPRVPPLTTTPRRPPKTGGDSVVLAIVLTVRGRTLQHEAPLLQEQRRYRHHLGQDAALVVPEVEDDRLGIAELRDRSPQLLRRSLPEEVDRISGGSLPLTRLTVSIWYGPCAT